MLNIAPIDQGDFHDYDFPTIDFKFQNKGTATALLWQFAVNILEAEIDPAPIFNFRVGTRDNALLIYATNNGWGIAHNCQIQIDEPLLNRLFTELNRQFRGSIRSGEGKEILCLTKEMADAVEFGSVVNGLPYSGLHLREFNAVWSCDDDNGVRYEGKEQVRLPLDEQVVLTAQGFSPAPGANYMLLPSDTTYISIIDPSKGPHEKKYLFSRKIPLGDVERFHIMIGASMSCHLLIRIKFYIDQATVIESEKFDIKIQCPRDFKIHRRYNDGMALRRDIDSKQEYVPYVNFNKTNSHRNLFDVRDSKEIFVAYGATQYTSQGKEHLKNGHYVEAVLAFEQAIRLNPTDSVAHYCKGKALYELERYEEAVLAFEQTIRLGPAIDLTPHAIVFRRIDSKQPFRPDPTRAPVYHNKGKALYKLGHYEEALADFEQTLRLDPIYSPAHYDKGKALYKLGHYEEALADFEQTLHLFPRFVPAYHNKSKVLYKLGRYEEALEIFEDLEETVVPSAAIKVYEKVLTFYEDEVFRGTLKSSSLIVEKEQVVKIFVQVRIGPSDEVFATIVPWETRIGRWAADFLKLLNRPLDDPDGRIISYVIGLVNPENPNDIRRLNSEINIGESGIRDGDILCIIPQMTAGGGKSHSHILDIDKD